MNWPKNSVNLYQNCLGRIDEDINMGSTLEYNWEHDSLVSYERTIQMGLGKNTMVDFTWWYTY